MWCENEIEYILEHLQDPERLMDGEFVEWLEKKEHYKHRKNLKMGEEKLKKN